MGYPLDFPGGSDSKASAYNVGGPGSIPGPGRSPGEGNGHPLQYSCLENPMTKRNWQATVHGVSKSWTQLNNSMCTHTHTHTNTPSYIYIHTNMHTYTHSHNTHRHIDVYFSGPHRAVYSQQAPILNVTSPCPASYCFQ